MLVKDLFEVLHTDSVVLANESDTFVDVEMTYIKEALRPYENMECKKLTPLNNAIEIIV